MSVPMRRKRAAGLMILALCAPMVVTSAAQALTITYGPMAAPQDPAGGGYPSSVKAYWRTDTAISTNTAYVSESPSGPWTHSGTDTSLSTRHEALVSGLIPDRTYYMYVQSGDVTSNVIRFRTGLNLLINGSFETWHPVSGQAWGTQEPDGWRGWEIYPWGRNSNHITIQMDRNTGMPYPAAKDQLHRASMDEGYRGCYGGLYQQVDNLDPGDYIVSGWISYTFSGTNPANHEIVILARDGAHQAGLPPAGTRIFSVNSGAETTWIYVQGTVTCTSGTITVYCNLRSEDWDGASFAHFDGMRLTSAYVPVIQFGNVQASRSVNGGAYDITLSYDTDIPATTQMVWGPTATYGNTTTFDPALVTHHVVQLQGVAPAAAPYHYRLIATAPPNLVEYSRDRTFDAPLLVLSDIYAAVGWGTATVCTVTWTTNFATTENHVFYRTAGSGEYEPVADAADPTARTSHSVVLAGLSVGTQYEYYVRSGAANTIPAQSTVRTFTTPTQPGAPIRLSMSMIGGSIPDGGDDVGPATQVKRMIQTDHPMISFSGQTWTSWAVAQPNDPGDGPNVYDWSALDAKLSTLIPGKALRAGYYMWGSSPSWVELDTPRFWQKFEEFIEAMTIHINQVSGLVYYNFENEPNISRAPAGWNWADWYIHCLQHFYPAVHRANLVTGMDNKVIAGNLSGHSANGFNDLYSRGLKNISDILGYHPYPYNIRDGLEVADLATIHGIQVQYGDGDKKIYVSEGWGSGRSAGFDRSSPSLEVTAQEVENMYLCMVNGWDNAMTPRTNWDPSYLWGMSFFCGNDNWGAMNWRKRAIPIKDGSGNITGFKVDGYTMTPDIAPYFWNGGMYDFYGNSKDCLTHVFPGNGLAFMNPGFEIPSEPPNTHLPHFWKPEMTPADPQYYNLDDSVIRGGSRSLRLSLPIPGYKGLWQVTAKRSALAGVSYRARVWCRTNNVTGGAAKFYMRFWDINGPSGMNASPRYWATDLTGTADWRQMEVVATSPSFTSRIEVGCYLTGAGTAWFDDVTIAIASQEEVGTVRGYTLDERQTVVPHCIVRTTTGGYQAVSDDNGYYQITNIPTGTYDFVCRKAGYVPFRAKNQTVAAGRLTFVSFAMGVPKPGLTVANVTVDRSAAISGEPAAVTVTVANSKPYPNVVSECSPFVEQAGVDATEKFSIRASESNPKVIPAGGQAQFQFTLTPKSGAEGGSFSVNAYAFGQEDRPNMLLNGGFDWENWSHHWSFTGGAQQLTWNPDTTDYYSPPRSLKCYMSNSNGKSTYNWANNWSAYGVNAVPAQPGRNYTIGVYHKDNLPDSVAIELFIQEIYYNGTDWLYNGRRFAASQHRSVWAKDVMMYDTGSPEINPGLYPTNRLIVSCGPCTGSTPGSGYSWWDDLFLKETGDWLADDRADAGASLVVPKVVSSLAEALAQPPGTTVRVTGPIVTAGIESFISRVYIEQPDRAAGCLVMPNGTAPPRGSEVTVTGKVGSIAGERALTDATLEIIGSPGTPGALSSAGRVFAPGLQLGCGLLVTAWGRVTSVEPDGSRFILDDGARYAGYSGVKVSCSGTLAPITPPLVGAFVMATGVVGADPDGSAVLRLRSPADLTQLGPSD